MNYTRRSVLAAGAATLGGLAGCLSEPDAVLGDSESFEGYGAFFALTDWATEVADDTFTFENPVEAGEMGHGWEPDGDLVRDIATTDAFIYLDTPEFAWAQNVAADLEREYDDITVIDGMTAVSDQLLSINRDPPREPDDDYDFDPATFELGEFEVLDGRTGEATAYWHDGHWHGEVPDIPVDESVTIEAFVTDAADNVVPIGNEPKLDARLADGAPEGHIEIESDGESLEISGIETGRTMIVFQLVSGESVVWESDADDITVDVVEDAADADADEFIDPHVWVDPVLAGEIVDEIATQLGDIDPDNADLYAENAAAYNDRLEEVDQAFEDLVADASRDVAVFAGHDSLQYVEHRYGFELVTPVGTSPDAAESFEDVADLVDVVEEHDIDTILYDPFEAPDPDEQRPQMVDLVLENSSATEYAPITPAEGTTQEWNDNGWGWIEQMEEITIPSLRQALDAD